MSFIMHYFRKVLLLQANFNSKTKQMRKLSPEEAAAIMPIESSRETRVTAAVKQLQVGEGLIIDPSDWKSKTPPYRAIASVGLKYKREFQRGRMPDGKGWFVKRLS